MIQRTFVTNTCVARLTPRNSEGITPLCVAARNNFSLQLLPSEIKYPGSHPRTGKCLEEGDYHQDALTILLGISQLLKTAYLKITLVMIFAALGIGVSCYCSFDEVFGDWFMQSAAFRYLNKTNCQHSVQKCSESLYIVFRRVHSLV